LASGLWHGASWSFVLWGAFHGLFLVLERGFLLKVYEKIGKYPSIIITFFLVMFGWIFFRIEKISDAFLYIKRMFTFNPSTLNGVDNEFITFLFIAIFFAFFTLNKKLNKIHDNFYFETPSIKKHLSFAAICFVLLMISIASITAFGFNPFIYFRF